MKESQTRCKRYGISLLEVIACTAMVTVMIIPIAGVVRGSALLVCKLASVVLSMESIAIIHSNKHAIAKTKANKTSIAGRHFAEGLLRRAIVSFRNDLSITGNLVDPSNGMDTSRCESISLSPSATQIRVFLYAGSTVLAVDVTVDPTTL